MVNFNKQNTNFSPLAVKDDKVTVKRNCGSGSQANQLIPGQNTAVIPRARSYSKISKRLPFVLENPRVSVLPCGNKFV
jgi:hypothetical protein